MKRIFEKRRKRQGGNALIEAALISPVLFLMLGGVIDFGRAFYFTDAATSAARSGAQYGIQSPANFNNYVGMQLAALNDAKASCTNSSGTAVTCDPSQTGQQAYIGPNFKLSTAASSFCRDLTGATVSCTSANARGYVQVLTSITYNLILPWPGLPNPLDVRGKALMRSR